MQQNYSSFKELLSSKKSPKDILSFVSNINAWDHTGQTLLSAAVEKNDKKLISVLLEQPALDLNYPDNPRPAFSQRCGRASQRCDIAHWLGFRVLPQIDPASLERLPQRQRCLNEHRARAMQALIAAISHFFNISTGLVHCTIEKLAELCGLVTVSKNGNRSITRASRCIQQMERFGLLQCENEWNAALGVWYPKIIQVTPLFFEAINISEKDWQAAIRQQQAYQRHGLAGPQEQLSQEQARERQIAQLREIHLKAKLARQEIKRARKLQQLTLQQQRSQISQSLIKSLSQIQIVRLGLPGFQKLVNQKLWEFRRLLGHSPPS